MREGTIVRTVPWGDYTEGSQVKITGERGTFRFLSHCLNRETGAEWLDVYGGGRNHQTIRSFKEDKVRLIRRRTRRKSTC